LLLQWLAEVALGGPGLDQRTLPSKLGEFSLGVYTSADGGAKLVKLAAQGGQFDEVPSVLEFQIGAHAAKKVAGAVGGNEERTVTSHPAASRERVGRHPDPIFGRHRAAARGP